MQRPLPRNIEVVDERVARALRAKTPQQRAAMLFDCHRFMRSVMEGGIRSAHADWPDEAVRREIARRLLDGTE